MTRRNRSRNKPMGNGLTFHILFDALYRFSNEAKGVFLIELFEAFTNGSCSCEEKGDASLRYYVSEKRGLPRKVASELLRDYDYHSLETFLNDLIADEAIIDIRNLLAEHGFKIGDELSDSEVPGVVAKLLKQVISDISAGKKKTLPREGNGNLRELSSMVRKELRYDGRSFLVDGEKLPIGEAPLAKDWNMAIGRLLEAYGERLGYEVSEEGARSTSYGRHLESQRRAYLKAKRRAMLATKSFRDGSLEIGKLKDEIYSAVKNVLLYENASDGFERLNKTLDMAVKAHLNDSLLLRIPGFVDVEMRKGLVHMLVEEGRIVSWVKEK